MRVIQPQDDLKIPAAQQLRTAPRQRVLKSAKVVLDNWCALDCMLRDVSETGAKIRISNSIALPHKFRLFTVTDSMIRDVRVAWKHNDTLGVIFLNEPKSCALRKF